jgi:hypothetical protein
MMSRAVFPMVRDEPVVKEKKGSVFESALFEGLADVKMGESQEGGEIGVWW